MTEGNLPALREARLPEAMAPADTDSWVAIVADVARLAEHIANTGFVPRGVRGNAPATAAAILYGREVGLPPMTSLNMLHVVEGTPGLSAEGMRALVLASGHDLEVVETTTARCTIRGRRRGSVEWTPVTWTMDDARHLSSKDNWRQHPRQMLQARATTELCRLIFPDVIHGFRSVEELEDMSAEVGTAAAALTSPDSGTKVRRRGVAKRPAGGNAPELAPVAQPPSAGPPLPGEAGYGDETTETTDTGAASSVSEEKGSGVESEGEAGETPLPTPETSVEQSGGPLTDPEAPVSTGSLPGEEADTSLASSPVPLPIGGGHHRMLMAHLKRLGVDTSEEGRPDRLAIVGILVGRQIESTKELLAGEAKPLLDALASCRDREAFVALVDTRRDRHTFAEPVDASRGGEQS